MKHLAHSILLTCREHPRRTAMRWQQDKHWQRLHYVELSDNLRRIAFGLRKLGVQAGDRVALLSANRPEWSLCDYALMSLRAISVPLFTSTSAAQIGKLVEDSGARMLLVAGEEPGRRALEVLDQGKLDYLIFLDSEPESLTPEQRARVRSLDELREQGILSEDDLLKELEAADTTELATIIYTSGTTGDPKGVMLQHGNFFPEIQAIRELFDINHREHSLCFLPLSHVFERAWTMLMHNHGACVTYLANPRDIADALPQVKPNVFCSVPRLFEKVHDVIHERLAAAPARKQRIFHWALAQGRLYHGLEGPADHSLRRRCSYGLANLLVLRRIRAALGGKKKVLAAGGAALAPHVSRFFHSAGLLIHQGYGLTETAPLVTCNTSRDHRHGSVGRPVPGVEVRVSSEGEILVKGPNVAAGYWNRPEESAATFRNGWFHTGDIGHIDSEGYLSITGRCKELIVTSGGKNVAPQLIEEALTRDRYIEQASAVGDGRQFIGALVVPTFSALEELAREQQWQFANQESLLRMPEVMEFYQQRIASACHDLADHEVVRRFALLPRQFSEVAGELTPTLKLRRHVISNRYQELIDSMYNQSCQILSDAKRGLDSARSRC